MQFGRREDSAWRAGHARAAVIMGSRENGSIGIIWSQDDDSCCRVATS